jgi:CTP:phosphocholine cytidylyltransferase-like protein
MRRYTLKVSHKIIASKLYVTRHFFQMAPSSSYYLGIYCNQLQIKFQVILEYPLQIIDSAAL